MKGRNAKKNMLNESDENGFFLLLGLLLFTGSKGKKRLKKMCVILLNNVM